MPVFWRNTKKGQTKELTKIYYLRAILINKYLRQNLDGSENLRSNQCKVGTLGHISIKLVLWISGLTTQCFKVSISNMSFYIFQTLYQDFDIWMNKFMIFKDTYFSGLLFCVYV